MSMTLYNFPRACTVLVYFMCNKNKIILTTGKGNINTFGGLKSMILSLSFCNEKQIKEFEVNLKRFFSIKKEDFHLYLTNWPIQITYACDYLP